MYVVLCPDPSPSGARNRVVGPFYTEEAGRQWAFKNVPEHLQDRVYVPPVESPNAKQVPYAKKGK